MVVLNGSNQLKCIKNIVKLYHELLPECYCISGTDIHVFVSEVIKCNERKVKHIIIKEFPFKTIQAQHKYRANKMRPSATDNNDFVHNLKDNSSYFDYFSPPLIHTCTHYRTNSFITKIHKQEIHKLKSFASECNKQ